MYEQLCQNGGAPRRRFPAIGEKPEGGGVFKHPPGPARVNGVELKSSDCMEVALR